MRFRPALLALLLALPPAALAAQPQAVGARALAVSEAVERIPLPGAQVLLEADPLRARIVLRGPAPKALATHLHDHPSTLCPTIAVEEGAVVLICRSRRFHAAIDGRFLDLTGLRGLPWRGAEGTAPPLLFWDPTALGVGGPCPGSTSVARGECALAAGDSTAAEAAFREAATGREWQIAELRLGDLALARNDVEGALNHWRKAESRGNWGRLAAARRCELLGSCLGSAAEARIFDPVGLPEPLRGELILRAARARAFQGALVEAGTKLLAILPQDGGPSPCAAAPALCNKITLELLASGEAKEMALAIYASLPDRNRGPLGAELAWAAAEAAESLGTPAFGAQSLAAALEVTQQSRLDPHLQRAAKLFLDAGDRARARVIVDFADARLGRAARSAAWHALRARIDADPGTASPPAARQESAEPAPSPPGVELDAAWKAIERARATSAGEKR